MPFIPTTTLTQGSGAMVLISDTVLGADTASFDITDIPGSYKHLLLKFSGRMTGAVTDDAVTLRFNGDSGGNYDWEYISGLGSGTSQGGTDAATSVRVGEIPGASATAGYVGAMDISVFDYASTALFKAFSSSGGRISTTRLSYHNSGQWRSTGAITRVTLTPGTGNFLAGSRLSIYGLN